MKRKRKDVGRKVESEADTSQLELFDPHSVTEVAGIRVFDVGQGDCIGLLDQDDRVFCYIDYGGLADYPEPENPAATSTRLQVQLGDEGHVSIVLTHWDKDHYWSANKKNPEARKCEWLVPRQMASPQAVLFAAELDRAKCWPEDRGSKPARIDVGGRWDIEIRKCGPFSKRKGNEDRNTTGLAITVLRWLGERVSTYMLLPGDCPFHLIPQLPQVPIRGLLAYHHGSRTHWTRKTKNAVSRIHPSRQMAYSHGRNWRAFRKNYQPEWDGMASTTVDARKKSLNFIDIRW
jgi:hypothetical protein